MVKNYLTAVSTKKESVCPHTLFLTHTYVHSHNHLLTHTDTHTEGVIALKKQILLEKEKSRLANAACEMYVLAFVLF